MPAVKLATRSKHRPIEGLHVLVVDDDHYARDCLRLLLAYYGASVIIARTPAAAVEILEAVRPDVVVTDIVFPRMEDGIWLRAQARERWPSVPFVAVSGEDIDRALLDMAGFVTFLSKPVRDDDLIAAVLAAVLP